MIPQIFGLLFNLKIMGPEFRMKCTARLVIIFVGHRVLQMRFQSTSNQFMMSVAGFFVNSICGVNWFGSTLKLYPTIKSLWQLRDRKRSLVWSWLFLTNILFFFRNYLQLITSVSKSRGILSDGAGNKNSFQLRRAPSLR